MSKCELQELEYASPVRPRISGHALVGLVNALAWWPVYVALHVMAGPMPADAGFWNRSLEGAAWFSVSMCLQYFGPLCAMVYAVSAQVRMKNGERLSGRWLALAAILLAPLEWMAYEVMNAVLV